MKKPNTRVWMALITLIVGLAACSPAVKTQVSGADQPAARASVTKALAQPSQTPLPTQTQAPAVTPSAEVAFSQAMLVPMDTPEGAKHVPIILDYVRNGQSNGDGWTCQEVPEDIKINAEKAAATWRNLLESNTPIPIKIRLCFGINPGMYGTRASNVVQKNITPINFQETLPDVYYYTMSLANQLTGSDLNKDKPEFDIKIDSRMFDPSYPCNNPAYIKVHPDCKPSGSPEDLETLLLHEMAHGFGFSGSVFMPKNGLAEYKRNSFHHFIVTGEGQLLASFEDSSNPILLPVDLLTSDNLYFNGPGARAANAENGFASPKIYAGVRFGAGSSLSHLDSTYQGTNPLMTYFEANRPLVHEPDKIVMGILHDIGWAPPNDDIFGAKKDLILRQTMNAGTATTAFDDPKLPCAGDTTGYRTVWYQYTPKTSGDIQIETNAGYDTILSVWTGERGSLKNEACNDDAAGRKQSIVRFSAQANTPYFIEVAAKTETAGPLVLQVSDAPCLNLITFNFGEGQLPVATPASSEGCPAGQYLPGEQIQLEAKPADGWHFARWLDANGKTLNENPLKYSMPDHEASISVFYAQGAAGSENQCFPLKVTREGQGKDPEVELDVLFFKDCPAGQYKPGMAITLVGAPADGWSVGQWEGASPDKENPLKAHFTMPPNPVEVKVVYEKPEEPGGD